MKRGIGLLAALAAFGLSAAPASAQKVGNPTNLLSATIDSGSLVAGTGHQLSDTFSGSTELFHNASIAADGTITVVASQIDHLSFLLPDYSGTAGGGHCSYSVTNGSVTVIPTSNATGLLNPFTGSASLDFHFYLQGTYTLNYSCFGQQGTPYTPSNCTIGDANSPLELQFTTGATSPAPPNTSISGTPYSDASGQFKVVDNAFSLPQSSNCDPQVSSYTLTGTFDQQAGLPSPDGYNTLIASGHLSPIIKRGVQAKLTATPASGLAPLTVHLDAFKSFVPAGAHSYAFTFGDGSHVTGTVTTVAHTYAKPGVYTATVTVVDKDGDHDTASLRVVVKKACTIPNVVGKQLAAAKTAITTAGCKVGTITKRQSTKPAGVVLAESPAAGKRVLAGSAVALVVSK